MKSKILIVDDEPEVRRVVRRALQELGHDVMETDDGSSVPSIIKREHPAVVVLDIHMPRVDGILALSEIQDIDPTTTVVMLTGDSDIKRIRLAMERGACEYLVKPFDVEELKASVSSSLARRAERLRDRSRGKDSHGA